MATAGTRKPRSPPRTVEEALDQFWKAESLSGHMPDYVGFMTWIGEKFEIARSVTPMPIHMQTSRGSEFELILQVIAAAKACGIEITENGAVPDRFRFGKSDGKRSALKCFNRGKLLLSFFQGLPARTRELFSSLSRDREQFGPTESLDPCSSQSEHRAAFFHAVAIGDGHAAFKMLGRLREEAHDAGELEFLEATAFFHANRLKDAIRHAQRVPNNSVDWRRAFMLIMEAYALQGNVLSIDSTFWQQPEFVFPPFFLRYICQVAVYNSPDPEASLERIAIIVRTGDEKPQSCHGVVQTWNRYTCQLGVQLIEQQQDLSLRLSAMEQGGIAPDSESSDPPLRTRQIQCALVLDPDLIQKISKCKLEDAYWEIVKRLVNSNHPTRPDFIQAFATQWRIGSRSVFLENVLKNVDTLTLAPDNDVWQVIGWAYQEALVLGRGLDARSLRELLLRSEAGQKWIDEGPAASASDRIARSLSPMGRLAFRSASWDLAQAETGSCEWRDAGMISLGFFRILELEINERLIFPVIRSIDFEGLEGAFKQISNQKQSKTAEFWQRIFPLLRRAKDNRTGLELGTLEIFLQKVRVISGADSSLKAAFHSEFLAYLSPSGIEAFRSGELGQLIEASARERFRNPAAHSRHIDIDTARECKVYIEAALDKLIRYSKRAGDGGCTLH